MTTDQPTEQHKPDAGFCIAWWNTGLSPTRDPKRAQEKDFQTAAAVLTHLIETAQADVIVLGEMSGYSVAGLRRFCPSDVADLHVGAFRNDEDEKIMRISDLPERLVIRSVDDEQRGRIIAGWDMDLNDGFSVSLVYNFLNLPCGNGDQLIEELGALMQSARVGRVIQEFQRGTV